MSAGTQEEVANPAPPLSGATSVVPEATDISPASTTSKGFIGNPGKVFRAFAFAGGAFDTAMQLGVAHAMVVSERQAPDIVVGISAGAVNAVTLAEVLQAGKDLPPECVREAQVTRLRKILHEYRQAPGALINAILPDGYEVNFSNALRPIRLPIHQKEERERRAEASRARSGVIHLINGVLRLRVSISTLTAAVRRILGLIQTSEVRDPKERTKMRFGLLRALWWLGFKNLHNCTPQVQLIAFRVLFHRWFAEREKRSREGMEAHQIIFGKLKRRFVAANVWLIGFPILVVLWLALGVALLLLSLLWNFGVGPVLNWLRGRSQRNGKPSAVQRIVNVLLTTYGINKGLGDSHFVRQFFIRLFDPGYYGMAEMDGVVASALRHNYASGDSPPLKRLAPDPKRLSVYSDVKKSRPPIHVAPMAASMASGKLLALPDDTPVVDALMAATAVLPLFPAVGIGDDTFVDGWNVSNEPTLALMDVLRQRLDPRVKSVEIYPVTPFPVSKGKLPSHKTCSSLVEVVFRAMQLRRHRDATLERRIVGLYKDAIDPEKAVEEIGNKRFISASVYPIELDEALELNERILRCSDEDQRRRMVEEAVADGCRATLEAMMQADIREEAGRARAVSCRTILRAHALNDDAKAAPGIPEICKACSAYRSSKRPARQVLTVNRDRPHGPAWPANGTTAPGEESNPSPPAGTPPQQSKERGAAETVEDKGSAKSGNGQAWPEARTINGRSYDGSDRPIIACLFSGGVFRGVFQIGVLNALKELQIKPDIMAGSSVGSIVAALGAKVFVQGTPEERTLHMARLAATFLSLDRLILTDRLADFVRRFTLRAAETGFSPSDADIVFRRYDVPRGMRYERCLRRVVAGLERLLYVSPYELNKLVRAGRLRRRREVDNALRAYVQEFLERYDVGEELLGSEPLRMLISKHILPDLPPDCHDSLPFNFFEEDGIRLLATTTNLSAGSLDIIGGSKEPFLREAFLIDGLLASSAFPGVFRPRFSWELGSGSSAETPFIDGGVMDNLPVAAVIEELTAIPNSIARRPRIPLLGHVPHLILAASLEVNVGPLSEKAAASLKAANWPQLWKRAGRLNYNRKLRVFAEAYRDLRMLHCHSQSADKAQCKFPDIEVLAVKPEWLCSTFAMHPMLGFRRSKQAASIAHGCAVTLARFSRAQSESPQWTTGWGIDVAFDNSTLRLNDDTGRPELHPRDHGDGNCWFRKAPCPFSRINLRKHRDGLSQTTLNELDQIYRLCQDPRTHRAEADG